MWSFFAKDPAKDFGYEIEDLIPGLEDKSIWRLHKAHKKATGEVYSVFSFDLKNGSDTQMELAKASVKRLKTLRHPNILTYVDSLEGDKVIYLVTEYVEPLETSLAAAAGDGNQSQLSIAWGVHQLTRALSFLSGDCGFNHYNICLPSIFVNQAGEWKLGGVEYMCKASESSGALPIKIIPCLEKYDPPEKSDSARFPNSKPWSADMWGLGCLIWEVFNGNMNSPSLLKSPGKIPKVLVPLYCELVSANPASRPGPTDFLARCRADRGYLKNNFVDTLLFLEEIQIKDINEKSRFFTQLPQHVDDFPTAICRYKILPQLISAFEFGGAGPTILTPLFKLGKLLSDDEYQKRVVPCVIKMFASTDRATRAKLLQQLEHFVGHLNANVLNAQVFPEIIHGFMDTNATIREVTVKSVLHLAPKLNHNNLNIELMKHFARLQAKDPEGGIRTNTSVCLGKIAHHLHPDTRKKVLVTAFTRAMRDPFIPARTAGIMALAATQKFYPMNDVAQRVLPALCQMTVDPEKSVREQAFKAIKGFLGKLEKVSEDPSLAEEIESEVNAASSTTMTDTALGWAGWAVTSLTSKLYKTSVGKPTAEATTGPVSQDMPAKPSGTTKAKTRSAIDKQSPESGQNTVFPDADDHNSDSDYEEESSAWNESWGEMDVRESPSQAAVGGTDSNRSTATSGEGWDTGWEDADFAPIDDPGVKSMTAYNWEQKTSVEEFPASKSPFAVNPPAAKSDGWDTESASWGDDGWGSTLTSTTGSGKGVQAGSKEEREQKRLQRKKEMEEKRALRQGSSGPMKLGERRKF